MALTILHISDLHRDPSHEVTNQALLDSLERDRDRYRVETPHVPDPDLIIVSGDIVHGVKADANDPDGELRKQYDQAEDFLMALARSFVGGDRQRVIIVPGNHDVSFAHALRGMKVLPVTLTTDEGRAAAAVGYRNVVLTILSARALAAACLDGSAVAQAVQRQQANRRRESQVHSMHWT